MKTFRLFLFLSLAFFTLSSAAQRGFYKSGVTVNGNYHDCTEDTPAFDFQHSCFGRFNSSGSLNMTMAEIFTWKNPSNGNTCPPTFHYRIYRTSDAPPSFSSLGTVFINEHPTIGSYAGDQQWQYNGTLNLLSGLTLSGTYVFEIYFEISGNTSGTSGCGDTLYDNNDSINNYRAYFEFENSDSFTNGDFTDPTWTSDNISNFNIINNSTVASLTGSEPSYTRTVRLNSSYSGGGMDSTYIATQINDWGASQEWNFWVGRNGQTLSTTNQNIIWLYADDDDLESPTINGYQLQMGDNPGVDEIRFKKVVGGVVTTLYTSTIGVGNGLTDYGITFRVTRSAAGVWNVYTTPLPQNSGEAATSPTAFGALEAAINQHHFNNVTDPSSPIAIEDDGYFGFMVSNSSATAALTAAEFDNFAFLALPPDTYFTFTDASSSIDEDNGGNIAIAVEIHHPSLTNASSVEVVLASGDANRTSPAYVTDTLTWAAGNGAAQYIYIDPNDNSLCDDHATLVFQLTNADGGDNAYVGAEDTHSLTILDDNMGYDDLASEDFEVALPVSWISSPVGRWSRTNTEAVGDMGYSLGHNAFGSTDSSSIAISLDTMPLVGVQTTWRFQVRYQQSGTATNRWLTFLSANTTNLRDIANVNGYALGFDQNVTGGADDSLCLFKITNGVHTVLINTGLNWTADLGTGNATGFEVYMDEAGEWSVRIDDDGGFDDLTLYGTPTTDITFPLLNAFGARTKFTDSASAKFRIDDISIEQKGCKKIWYSQGTGGNSNDAIWWSQTTGGNIAVSGSRFDRFQIQTGDNVTANGLWIADDIAIETGATLTGQANTDLRLFGDWFNDGTFLRSTSNITFRGTQNQSIFGSATTQFYDLTIDNDGNSVTAIDSVIIRNVARVNEGTFNVNGKVHLISSSVWSGSIGEIKPAGSVTGLVSLSRYIPSIPNQYGNWFNLGNPLTGLTLAAWNADMTTTGFAGSDFPAPYPFTNIRFYNETTTGSLNNGYTNVTNITNPLMTDRGYFVWLAGPALTLRTKGQIQQGSFNDTLSHTSTPPTGSLLNDGWNLMTNPYPSEIDWNRVSANLSGPRVYYVFDYQTNAYKYWQATGEEGGTGNASRYIAHSQAFMVKVNVPGQYLTYQEDFKTNTGAFFERSAGESTNSFVALQLARNGMMDENLLFFDEESNSTLDSKDVLHLASLNENSIQLSFVSSDGQALVQDTRPFNQDVEILVHAKMPEAGTYDLIIPETANLPAGTCLYIQDMITGQSMALSNGSSMQVTIENPFDGIRFKINGNAPAQVVSTDATCFGEANGTLDINVPAQSWSVKINDEMHDFEYVATGSVTLDGLRAGTYQVEVINPNATCASEVKSYTIGEPTEISANLTSSEPAMCNEGNTGSIAWAVNNADWFSFELMDEQNNTIAHSEVDGNTYFVDQLNTGLYAIKLYTECGTQTLYVDLHDKYAPSIAVDAPSTVALNNEAVSVWLNASVANAQSIQWTLSNGQTGEGEMFEAIIAREGIYTYTATAKGNACEKITSGTFEVKSLIADNNAEKGAITLLQQQTQMTINFGKAFEGMATVQVMDNSGRVVIKHDVNTENGQSLVLDTAQLSTGVYTVQIANEKEVLFIEKVYRN